MSDIKLGIQLYSVRGILEDDVEQTMKELAAMGYEGVEFFGPSPASAQDLKTYLEKYDLECCGWHYWGDPLGLRKEEKLKKTVELYETIDNNSLVISSIPEKYRSTIQDWEKMAEYFNQLAETLAPYDIKLGYHNHDFEFKTLEDQIPWNVFFDNLDPKITMQLDVGNAYYGGADPVEVLRKYGDRAHSVHLKPYSPDQEDGFQAIIGEDQVPWEEIFAVCDEIGNTEWYIVEYEARVADPLQEVKRCLEGIKKIRGR